MKTNIKQTIIIGAGGSYPYNFPLGEDLFDRVQETYVGNARSYSYNTYNTQDTEHTRNAEIFVRKLKGITGITLDKYINLHPNDKIDGLKALSIEILTDESNSLIPGHSRIDGDWYKYLFTKMISGLNTFEEIKNGFHNNLSFITFNYDRSLENYLFTNLYNVLKSDDIKPFDIAQIIESIPFVHVYGKPGYLEWETNADIKKTIPYGKFDWRIYKQIENVIDMIQLIYDERKNSDQINKAKSFISDSKRVLFCGFGYDPQNLEILGFPNIIQDQQVFGTALKNTTNEISHIKNLISNMFTSKNVSILDLDCLTILREHLLV